MTAWVRPAKTAFATQDVIKKATTGDLLVQQDPYQPTDVATFNSASVPCLTFFTGTHVDYHKPSDSPDKIDYEDLDRIVDFAAAIVRSRNSRTRGYLAK